MKAAKITTLWDEQAIYETIVCTENEDGSTRIAPLGARRLNDHIVLAPFAPSGTLDNIKRTKEAVINLCEDVSIFAGCITGRYDWPTVPCRTIKPPRLTAANSHLELQVTAAELTGQRAQFICTVTHEQIHQPFTGFNRARSAVIEAAVHISRIGIIATADIRQSLDALQPQIEKTAGAKELQAWQWLQQHFKEKTQ